MVTRIIDKKNIQYCYVELLKATKAIYWVQCKPTANMKKYFLYNNLVPAALCASLLIFSKCKFSVGTLLGTALDQQNIDILTGWIKR